MKLLDHNDVVLDEPAAAHRQRRPIRRLRIVIAGIVVAATAVAATLIAAPGDERTIVEPAIPGDSTPTTGVAPPAQEALSDTSRLRLDGIGPVVIGMTLDEASAATGQAIRINPRTDLGNGCAHAAAEGGPEGLRFMVVNGRIVRVEAGRGPVRTVSGVGAGSTEAEVRAAYPDRIRVEPNPYTRDLESKYLIYLADGASSNLSLLFEVDGGAVRTFRSGFLGPVMAPEGCA